MTLDLAVLGTVACALGAAASSPSSPGPAAGIFIDFDGLDTSAGPVAVTNQFLSKGVAFQSLAVGDVTDVDYYTSEEGAGVATLPNVGLVNQLHSLAAEFRFFDPLTGCPGTTGSITFHMFDTEVGTLLVRVLSYGIDGELLDEQELTTPLSTWKQVSLLGMPVHRVRIETDQDGAGFDNLSFAHVVTSPPASEVPRVGEPPNPHALLPGLSSGPVVGGSWDPRIDHVTFLPGAVVDFLAITATGANVPIPPLGTLLCDLSRLVTLEQVPAGQPFAVAIPADCGLFGASLCSQGASLDGAGLVRLTNALDITLGGP